MSSKPFSTTPDRACAIGLGLVLLAHGGHALAAGESFDRAVRGVAQTCVSAASTSCAQSVFRLADANRDGKADSAELSTLNDRLRVWARANAETLPQADRQALNLGFLLIDSIGL